MRESRDNYIIRRIREEKVIDVGNHPSTEIDIYKKNIADLQEQLQNSYIKQKQLGFELYALRKRVEQLESSPDQKNESKPVMMDKK